MSTHLLATLACISTLLAGAAPAVAQDGAPAATPAAAPAPTAPVLFPEAGPAPRNWAVTMSPVHLFLPVIEIAVERRIERKLGIAVMVGGGSIENDQGDKFTVSEVGLSARYYVLGSFAKGMQLGGALEYLKVKSDDINGSSVSVNGSGFVVAPFIGYKRTFGFGLTLDGQLGAGLIAVEAEADNGAMEEESRVSAYLNLNIGWSF
jgi:hypothetical protein